MKRKVITSLLVLGFLFFSPLGVSFAEETYQITETELTQLEQNLSQLKNINQTQQQKLKEQKGLLKQAEFDLEELQIALKNSKEELNLAKNSLKAANESLLKYEQEEKAKRKKLETQRNIAYVIVGGLLAVAIAK